MKIKHLLFLLLTLVGISANAQEWTWKGETPVSGGKYYLRANLGDGVDRFLNNTTNSFDASPAVLWTIGGTFPSEYTLSSAGGNFVIRKPWGTTVETNSNRTGDDAKLSSSENNGLWEIHRTNTFLGGGNRNIAVSTSGLSTANTATNCWEFISEAQVKAYQEYVAMQTNIDMTFAIKNPSFEIQNSGWEYVIGTANEGWHSHNLCGGLESNRCAEAYHEAFTVSQTLTNIPNGRYQMTAQGFYRQDDGVTETVPYFFANDEKKDVPVKTGTEDNMDQASASFTNGLYTIDPIVVDVTDGTLTIGIKSESAVSQWCIFDNFRLTLVAPKVKADMTVNATFKYGTFCAPFAVEIPAGVTAYTVDDVEGNTLVMDAVETTTIPANTPVILNAEEGLEATSFYGLAVEGTPAVGLLTGVYTATLAPVGSYVLQNNDSKFGFYKVDEGKQPTVGANRAYLTVSAAAPAFFFDTETAIEAVEALTTGEAAIYDINGVKQQNLQKGINIVKMANGKTQKVLVK